VTPTLDVLFTADRAGASSSPDDLAPRYAHPGDAGADLLSSEALVLRAGHRALVGTGVSIALPEGHAAFVVPRSGLAAKHGITVVNSPGTVDAGYRGEIKVTLLNTDLESDHQIEVGDKIAQLVVVPVVRAVFVPVDELPESSRGTGGFGSTGYAHTTGGTAS
jgi:dUTP pyrophosphatase